MGQILQLMYVFFKIGTFSIGGGYAIIPLIQEQVVEHYHWVSRQTFTDIVTISQMTPGPLAVNTSTFIGIQIAGIRGAVFATAGCVISGVCISVLLYRFFKRHRQSKYILEVLNGLKASSLGLIISAAATILLLAFAGTETISRKMTWDWIAVAVFISTFIVIRKWKINPILVIIAAGIIGGFVYS